jgi:enoyl-CoA hydratase/carnithine racemase
MALEDGLRLELGFFEEMLHSQDYKEGLQAKAEGRKLQYKGQLIKLLEGRPPS